LPRNPRFCKTLVNPNDHLLHLADLAFPETDENHYRKDHEMGTGQEGLTRKEEGNVEKRVTMSGGMCMVVEGMMGLKS
jgi:hypothetical protein